MAQPANKGVPHRGFGRFSCAYLSSWSGKISPCKPRKEKPMSVAGGAAAAAQVARRMRQEEEEMTPYSKSELADNWEFKIIRSSTNTFRDPAKTRAILEEEARAGWMLVEKFDNSRIRLKRPASARAGDGNLGFDPYRTTVGLGERALALIIIGAVLGSLAIVISIIVAVTRR
jgi:hypothetical protein